MDKKSVELVLDIETVGKDLEKDFSSYEKYQLLKYDTEDESFESKTALYPPTGEIVAIGAKNIISQKGFVVFQAGEQFKEPFQEEKRSCILYGCVDEKEVLETFWSIISAMEKGGYPFNRLITFNGKSFDIPYLLFRSAAHEVAVPHSMGHRGSPGFHTDLLEELSFYRKIRRFKLEILSTALGIPHHRTEDYNGKKVWGWFREGMVEEIAFFCYQDVELIEKVYWKLKKSWNLFF
jgi:DNA polymerase elongation subunit (family B)